MVARCGAVWRGMVGRSNILIFLAQVLDGLLLYTTKKHLRVR